MTEAETERQIQEINNGLISLFVGKDKYPSIVAALSIASTAAFMIGMPKLELQKILMRMYDKRVAEAQHH